MTNEIKPIETIYNFYKFRSRLEARWAIFFDEMNIYYEYEPEGFNINGVYYLPDFKINIPRHGSRYIEVKPLSDYPNNQAMLKIQALGGWVVHGDPSEAIIDIGKTGGCIWYAEDILTIAGFNFKKFKSAATYARQARFEHGETPSTAFGDYIDPTMTATNRGF